MKIVAFYLPQFHNIPENNEWWGDGFTEWSNVKSASPIYEGHHQPKVPLDNNYYNLLDDNVKIWQANIAKEHGIYGFCYYHYWFNGRLILEKPMEQMLANPDIDIPFCVCWANEAWTKSWTGKKTVLLPQTYGDSSDWKKHFDYLLPFFRDPRYIKEDEKPLIVIYRPKVMDCVTEMMSLWNDLAIEAGFPGLKLMCLTDNLLLEDTKVYDSFESIIEWQPNAAKFNNKSSQNPVIASLKSFRRSFFSKMEQLTGIDLRNWDPAAKMLGKSLQFISYDSVWEQILNIQPSSSKSIPGAFIRWDNTPRFHEKGSVIIGENPVKFYNYMKQQIVHARNDYKSDMIFFYAWNEWAEGGYLEPDTEYGYDYLIALKKALMDTGELPVRTL